MTMGHQVAVLDNGVLQQVDTPRALYDRLVNVFVAGFIGPPAMNIKTVPLTEDGAAFADMILPLTREQVDAALTDGTAHVQVGFCPENTGLVGPDDAGMPIHVDLVEELGSDAYVYGTGALEGQDERFVVRVDSPADTRADLQAQPETRGRSRVCRLRPEKLRRKDSRDPPGAAGRIHVVLVRQSVGF
jgi:multiple sugar transport system ATP-binding protein